MAAGKAYKADPIEDKPDETPFFYNQNIL